VTVQQSAAFSYFLSGAAIGHTLHLGLKLIWFTTLAPCTAAPESLISQTCSPAMFSLPADRVAILVLVPLIAQLFLPAVRLGSSLISWLVGCVCLAVAYARLGVFADTFVLLAVFFVPFLLIKSDTAMWSSFTLYEQTRRDAEYALSAAEWTRTLERTILENEKLNVETRAAELRSMMGNVAHDLKTPIQSIAMAVELLRCVVLFLFIVQCLVACVPLVRACALAFLTHSIRLIVPCVLLPDRTRLSPRRSLPLRARQPRPPPLPPPTRLPRASCWTACGPRASS
jgi:signal transduction histidine kinase